MSFSLRRLVESASFLIHHDGFRRAPLRRLARVVGWFAVRATGKTPEVQIRRWNAFYRLPRIARGPAKVFYVFEDDYEPEVRIIESILKAGDVFLDVGANFGLFTIMASRLVGESGSVLAFEPFPPALVDLETNVKCNVCRNVTIQRCALSDRGGTADLFVHEDPGRNTLGDLGLPGGDKVTVPLETLDELVQKQRIVRIDFIKMDVEGAEELVLRGAVRSIRRFKPLIAFEMTHIGPPRFGLDVHGAWNLLAAEGYKFFDFTMAGLVPVNEPASANTLGVPKDFSGVLPMA